MSTTSSTPKLAATAALAPNSTSAQARIFSAVASASQVGIDCLASIRSSCAKKQKARLPRGGGPSTSSLRIFRAYAESSSSPSRQGGTHAQRQQQSAAEQRAWAERRVIDMWILALGSAVKPIEIPLRIK